MRYIGKKSMSSILGILVTSAFYLQVIFSAVLFLLVAATMLLQPSRTYSWPVTFSR